MIANEKVFTAIFSEILAEGIRSNMSKEKLGELAEEAWEAAAKRCIKEFGGFRIRGLGKFEVKDVAERTYNSPVTGTVTKPAHKAVKATASKKLNDLVQ